MIIALWATVFLMGFALSVVLHETGHVLAGVRHGWEYNGIAWRKLAYGAGVKLGHKSKQESDWHLGTVALAGPLGSLTACVLFLGLAQLPIEHNWIFGQLALLNFALFVFNLLPLPMTDGGLILYALTGWRARWRYIAAAWVVAEVLAVIALAVVDLT